LPAKAFQGMFLKRYSNKYCNTDGFAFTRKNVQLQRCMLDA